MVDIPLPSPPDYLPDYTGPAPTMPVSQDPATATNAALGGVLAEGSTLRSQLPDDSDFYANREKPSDFLNVPPPAPDAPPSSLDIATGRKTTIPEDTAWGAFQTLKANPKTLDEPQPDGTTLRARLTDTVSSYYEERKAYGQKPFPTHAEQAVAARNAHHEKLFSGLDKLDATLSPEQKAALDDRAKLAPDPDSYRARAVNFQYLRDLGAPVTQENYPIARSAYAVQLGLPKDADDKALYNAIGNRQRVATETTKTLSTAIQKATETVLKGDGRPEIRDEQLRALIAATPEEHKSFVRQQFTNSWKDARDLARQAKPVVDQIMPLLLKGATAKEGSISDTFGSHFEEAGALLPAYDPRGNPLREAVLAGLEAKMKALTPDSPDGIPLFEALQRGTGNLARGTFDMGVALRSWSDETAKKAGMELPGTDRRADAAAVHDDARKMRGLTAATAGSYKWNGDKGFSLRNGLLSATESVPYTLLAFEGPAGFALMSSSMGGQSFQDARQANPDASPARQAEAALVSGALQAGIETVFDRAGLRMAKMKVPGLFAALNKSGVTNATGRAAVTGTAAALGIAATEYTEEAAQQATDRALQDMALSLSGIDPTTNWKGFFNDWNPASGSQVSMDTLGAILPYALIGGGAASFRNYRFADTLQRSTPALRALGIPEERVQAVATAPTLEAATAELRSAWNDGLDLAAATLQRQKLSAIAEETAAFYGQSPIQVIQPEPNDFTGETTYRLNLPDVPARDFETLDDAFDALRDFRANQLADDLDILNDATRQDLIDFMTGEYSATANIRITDRSKLAITPDEAVKQGLATREQITERLRIHAMQEGVDVADLDLSSLRIHARRFSERMRDGSLRQTVEYFQGADPLNVAEDIAETYWTAALDEGLLRHDEIVGWIRQAEQATGNSYLDPNHDSTSERAQLQLTEALSAFSREYLAGNVADERLPEKFRRWLHTLIATAAQTFRHAATLLRSKPLMDAVKAGKIDSRFVALIADSVGLNQAETDRRFQNDYQAQLAAEAMGGVPEISEAARGMLPHPETARQRQHPLAGELQRLYDSLKTPTRRRRKDGSTIDSTQRANSFFLPIGEWESPDDVRQSLNEKGFAFDTPAALLSALDDSLNYNLKSYATQGGMLDQSFSVGGSKAVKFEEYANQGKVFEGYNDGLPRFEMDASQARFLGLMKADKEDSKLWNRSLSEVMDWPELYDNYPEATDITVQTALGMRENVGGTFSLRNDSITLNANLDTLEHAKTLLHELQHWIQKKEGFDQGGSATKFRDRDLKQETLASILAAQSLAFESIPDPLKESARIINRGEDQDGKAATKIQADPAAKLAWANYINARRDYQEVESSTAFRTLSAKEQYLNLPGEIEARGVQARASMTAEERQQTPFLSQWGTFSLSASAIGDLEKLIAQKLTEGPAERAQILQTLRNRLAGVLQRQEDIANGVHPLLKRGSLDPVQTDRLRQRELSAQIHAIISAFPPEVRGKVNFDSTTLLDADGPRSVVNAMKSVINRLDDALEPYLQEQYLDALAKLIDLGNPIRKAGETSKSKLTPETQRTFDLAVETTRLTPTELSSRLIATEAAIAELSNDPDADGKELVRQTLTLNFLETFGALHTRSAAELEHAHQQLLSIYSSGRMTRRILDDAQREERAAWRKEILESLGLPYGANDHQHTAGTSKKGLAAAGEMLQSLRLGMSSFHQVMEWILPKSTTARMMQAEERKAATASTRLKLEAHDRFNDFFATRLGLKTRRQRNAVLARLSERKDTDIRLLEGIRSKSEKLTIEQAQRVLRGQMNTGWENDRVAMESLRQAYAEYQLLPKKNRDAREFIRFDRVTQRGNESPLIASQLELLNYHLTAQQAEYLPALDKWGYTEDVLTAIKDKLEPETLALADFLATEYADGYHRLNPVHRAVTGMDMPQIRNYSPGRFENAKGSANDALDAFGSTLASPNALAAGFTKNRKAHMARPQKVSALASYWGHVATTSHFIAYAELCRDMGAAFKTPEIRRAIEARFGKKIAGTFSQWLDAIALDGQFQATVSLASAEIGQRVLAGQAAIGLAYNLGVLLKQASAGLGFLMEMPLKDAAKGLMLALSNPQALTKLWNTETIRQRIDSGFSPEDRQLLTVADSKPSLILDLLAAGRLPIAWTDAAMTTISGSVAYQFHRAEAIKQGLNEQQAEEIGLAAMDRVIFRTAQPNRTAERSLDEITTAHPFMRTLFQFKSDPRQKFALATEAIAKAIRGDITKGEAAKKFLVTWALYGLMAQVAADSWKAISRDDDDDDYQNWQPKDYLAAMIAGPIAGVTYLGSAADFLIHKLITGKAFTNSSTPIEGALAAGLAQISKASSSPEKIDLNDIVSLTRSLGLLATTLDPRAAAIPVALKAVRDGYGIGENAGDLFFGESPAEQMHRIIREAKADAKKAKETAPPKPLTDRQLARKEIMDGLTPQERSLKDLPEAIRREALDKILLTLPENERESYKLRLQNAGILP
jgi:hypothetical protein